ncbi:MAG: hypothetical protein R2827_05770 [Bdellovibrionales bacterium]
MKSLSFYTTPGITKNSCKNTNDEVCTRSSCSLELSLSDFKKFNPTLTDQLSLLFIQACDSGQLPQLFKIPKSADLPIELMLAKRNYTIQVLENAEIQKGSIV